MILAGIRTKEMDLAEASEKEKSDCIKDTIYIDVQNHRLIQFNRGTKLEIV